MNQNPQTAMFDLSKCKLESYRAGPEADQPCVRFTVPGVASHTMPVGVAMNLAGWLVLACRAAFAGLEQEITFNADDGRWLATMLTAAEGVAKGMIAELEKREGQKPLDNPQG